MTADYDREAVLAQVAERRRRSEERIAQLDDVPVLDLLRERLGEQVARRAEQRGQLDLGGAT